MRHAVAGYKLSRKTSHRKAMWRNMAIALFTHGQITTTLPKAKSLKPFVEKLISAAKQGDLASRRRVIAAIGDPLLVRGEDDENVVRNRYGEVQSGPKVVKKLFDEIAPTFADRQGGYTRIIKLARHRIGDGADLCVMQLLGQEQTGPQVAGKYSRRREKANHRMERAAALRKAQASTPPAPASEPAAEA
jgi:large subunit ribosomal protein L17